MFKSITVPVLAAFAFVVFHVYADDTGSMQKDMAQKAASQVHQGRGVVNKVDLDAGKLNISHEAIKSLKWPQMTMDFKVQNKSVLDGVKPGMKVEIEIVKFADGYRITRIVQARE